MSALPAERLLLLQASSCPSQGCCAGAAPGGVGQSPAAEQEGREETNQWAVAANWVQFCQSPISDYLWLFSNVFWGFLLKFWGTIKVVFKAVSGT